MAVTVPCVPWLTVYFGVDFLFQSTIALAFVALALLLIYVGLCWWKGRDAVTTHPDHGYAL